MYFKVTDDFLFEHVSLLDPSQVFVGCQETHQVCSITASRTAILGEAISSLGGKQFLLSESHVDIKILDLIH